MLVKFAVINYRGFNEFDLGHPRKYKFNAFTGATMKLVNFNINQSFLCVGSLLVSLNQT